MGICKRLKIAFREKILPKTLRGARDTEKTLHIVLCLEIDCEHLGNSNLMLKKFPMAFVGGRDRK